MIILNMPKQKRKIQKKYPGNGLIWTSVHLITEINRVFSHQSFPFRNISPPNILGFIFSIEIVRG